MFESKEGVDSVHRLKKSWSFDQEICERPSKGYGLHFQWRRIRGQPNGAELWRLLTACCGAKRSRKADHCLQRPWELGVPQLNFHRLNSYREVISVLSQLASELRLILELL